MAKVRVPTEEQTKLLRRIATYPLLKTMTADGPAYASGGRVVDKRTAELLIRNGWVKPSAPGLLPGCEQTYVALKPPKAA